VFCCILIAHPIDRRGSCGTTTIVSLAQISRWRFKAIDFLERTEKIAQKNHTVTVDQLSTAISMAEGPNAHVVEQRTMRPGAVVVATVVQRLLQTLELALLVVGVCPSNPIRQRWRRDGVVITTVWFLWGKKL